MNKKMNPQRLARRKGLILLVVLGMLSLFSLLAVSYVVVSSQSRSANAGMSGRDFRGTPPEKLLDLTMRQVLRGTTDRTNPIAGHGLLADLFGANRSPIPLRVRHNQFSGATTAPTNFPLAPNAYPDLNSSHNERPVLIAGRFLRIPIVHGSHMVNIAGGVDNETPYDNPNSTNINEALPQESDAWTGRIVTFLDGPLRMKSARVVRYIGNTTASADPAVLAQAYSLLIDLGDMVDDLVTHNGITRSVSEWAIAPFAANQPALHGLSFCYDNPNGAFGVGARLLLNDAPLNAFGWGLQENGAPETFERNTGSFTSQTPTALQPNYPALGVAPAGDADESYDAPDYANLFLSYQHAVATGPLQSQDIIPSFHRAALINYLVHFKDPRSYNENELVNVMQQIEAACLRPLSYRVRTSSGVLLRNFNFSGSNRSAGSLDRSPQLDVTYDNNWGAAGGGAERFIQWVQWLTRGDWDVDNNADGVPDSIWLDPHTPLMTSREGKLLKMLVSYQIEDLDGRIDLHATGNRSQVLSDATRPYNAPTTNAFQRPNSNLPQGFGYGPAEINPVDMFTNTAAYAQFLGDRYGSDGYPGANLRTAPLLQDARSAIAERERRIVFRHDSLPGLPVGIRGRVALGFDHFGNPLLNNNYVPRNVNPVLYDPDYDQATKDPYEARWLAGGRGDQMVSWSAWERMYRLSDWDRSAMTRGLQVDRNGALRLQPGMIQAVTPASSHLRHTPLAHPTTLPGEQVVEDYRDLIRSLAARRNFPGTGNGGAGAGDAAFAANNYRAAFDELFPFEFHLAQPMNVNRPFGNGVDDDNDGQIDEPEELAKGRPYSAALPNTAEYAYEVQTNQNGPVATRSSVYEDYTLGVGRIDPQLANENAATQRQYRGSVSRQLFARHIYCLAMLILPDELYVGNRPSGQPIVDEERARVIAQWVVNLIDFRDADVAMTRFPYDPEPFRRKNDPSNPGNRIYWVPHDPSRPIATVVWGNEPTDLLLTESLATHDVRAKDLDAGGGSRHADPQQDPDFDQYRTPEGSLFLELFNPKTTAGPANPNTPAVPRSMYTTNANSNMALNVSATDRTGTSPVWRIGISPPYGADTTSSPLLLSQNPALRNYYTYQISEGYQSNGLVWNHPLPAGQTGGNGQPPLQFDRVILFTNPRNEARARDLAEGMPDIEIPNSAGMSAAQLRNARAGRVYFNQQGQDVLVAGGQYLVVGPRAITYFGSQAEAGPDPMVDMHQRMPNDHRIVLGDGSAATLDSAPGALANWTNIYVQAGQPKPRYQLRPCVTMIAGISDSNFNTGDYPEGFIGVNVSAPHVDRYYQAPTQQINSGDMGNNANGAVNFSEWYADGYDDFAAPAGTSPGTPFDSGDVDRFPLGADPADPMDASAWNWIAGHEFGIPIPGSQENWCTAYLQRLADPDRPYHATYNPYVTMDWMPIDLTVFSGEEDQDINPGTYHFASRHKNGSPADQTGFSTRLRGRTHFSYATDSPRESSAGGATGLNFTHELPSEPSAPTTRTQPNNNHATFGYTNSSYWYQRNNSTGLPGIYTSAPRDIRSPYWADRPFVNSQEIALVPMSAPGQLSQEFTVPDSLQDVYLGEMTPNQYGYLPNFFQELANPGNATGISARQAVPSSLLFELLTTPSPWQDTDDYIRPADVDPASLASLPQILRDAITQQLLPLRAPYNMLSSFREPGRVNINTMTYEAVYNALMRNANGQHSQIFADLMNSRRGYPDPSDPAVMSLPSFLDAPNPHLNPAFPTQFAGVFKSPLAAGVVPTTRPADSSRFPDGVLDADARNNPAQTTLLRSLPTPINVTVPNGGGSGQLFVHSPSLPLMRRLGANTPDRPFTDYLPFSRLQNLTTTRSNLFAMRVTIGYFEYDPSTGIGREYGVDDGTALRHRAFYVIDRSIPVGFQEGQDLNTENCVLVRRIIE